MQIKKMILKFIENKRDIKGILLLIDYAFMMGKITSVEKLEFLTLIDVESYDIMDSINYIPKLFHNSTDIDAGMVKLILIQYVRKSIITKEKSDEIVSLCN